MFINGFFIRSFFGLSFPVLISIISCVLQSQKFPKKYLFTPYTKSINAPLSVLFPSRVKSVFIAGVPEYRRLSVSAFFVQLTLKSSYSLSGSFSKTLVSLLLLPIPSLFKMSWRIFLAKTDCTTFVLSRQSIQFVLKIPFWLFLLLISRLLPAFFSAWQYP